MSDSMGDAVNVSGHCYCGDVQFKVDIPAGEAPIFAVYCHCDSCRRAHSAPLYHVVCVDQGHLEITAGAEHIVEFTRPGATLTRAFCSRCGSRVLNRFGAWRPKGKLPVAFFPNLLRAEDQVSLHPALKPRRNSNAEECVLNAAILDEVIGRGAADEVPSLPSE